MNGVVLSDHGGQVIVDAGGQEIACVIRKSLRRGRPDKPVVVGDRVEVEQSGEGAAVVRVEERRNVISRADPGRRHREQVLVANVDEMLVVASARSPDLVPGLVDRFLAEAESRGIEAAIVVNKTDLDPERVYEPVAGVYRGIGYTVLETSAVTGEGLGALRELLTGKTTFMLGHSGVGKSSLANALDPSLELRTGEVHDATGLGIHTTSAVSLLRLPWGGYLVDTPGIREFGLWAVEEREVGGWFREIAAHAQDCRFNDCMHESEPDCAVKRAVLEGQITAWRYESYLRILGSLREDG